MGIIEVPCANTQCDNTHITKLNTVELTQEFKHNFQCDICDTTFSIYTRLGKVTIPKEIKS